LPCRPYSLGIQLINELCKDKERYHNHTAQRITPYSLSIQNKPLRKNLVKSMNLSVPNEAKEIKNKRVSIFEKIRVSLSKAHFLT
jgi:hypothetical protein